MIRAVSYRITSPVGWPYVSLTGLKRSRSIITTAMRLAGARAALELLVQQLVHVAVVEQLGQPVGDGELLEPLVGHLQLAVLLVQLVLQALDAEHGAHPRLQLGEVDRLADVVVGAAVQPLHHVLGLAERRDQDDGDEGERVVVLDAPGDLVAVHPRHHHVEQDQVRRLVRDPLPAPPRRWWRCPPRSRGRRGGRPGSPRCRERRPPPGCASAAVPAAVRGGQALASRPEPMNFSTSATTRRGSHGLAR